MTADQQRIFFKVKKNSRAFFTPKTILFSREPVLLRYRYLVRYCLARVNEFGFRLSTVIVHNEKSKMRVKNCNEQRAQKYVPVLKHLSY
jgi:hypothetical protein